MAGPPAHLDVRDEQVHMDTQTQRWVWEGNDGVEYEWHGRAPRPGADDAMRVTDGAWVRVISEADIAKQQEVYRVAGVDEHTPAKPVLKRQSKKRKDAPAEAPDAEPAAPAPAAPAKRSRPNTSVFVSGLPLDASMHEIADVFARYGVLLEDDEGKPRVKMYHDEATQAFKGEALVVYFKPESVELAIQLLDDTYLRAASGATSGPRMRVQHAEFHEEPRGASDERRELSDADKKSIRRRMNRMHNKINDWDSGSDDERVLSGPSSAARTVVLKKMFTLAELDEDPSLLLDLKQDVREECETLGDVTNVVLWDREPEGIMTVRFREPASARACERRMNGRYFAGRQIIALLVDGKPKFRRVARDEPEENARHDAFGAWLEQAP
ncbi:hypothetical protein MCAP1_000660 [Malassezia caprae]|uniref:RRM domain-containing protein n=1 Tax=Malassezia caprae TaxID=1381934 RepID=A0AAF0IV77_9BASI|nr:hypothetical protein MCAP1_000660 [Malassezia caprae]